MKPPAFQFYADDFLAGTFSMSNEERGLYITLLCRQWTQGHVTKEEMARLSVGMAQPLASHVFAKFRDCGSGEFKNDRMESERGKQESFRANRSESGKLGANKRWHSHSTAIAQPMAKHSSPSPSPSPSPKEREKEGAHADFCETPSWKEFWDYCQSPACSLVAEWFARDKFLAAESDNWAKARNWRAYANRCKGWWESDGRPMTNPKQNNPEFKRGGGNSTSCIAPGPTGRCI